MNQTTITIDGPVEIKTQTEQDKPELFAAFKIMRTTIGRFGKRTTRCSNASYETVERMRQSMRWSIRNTPVKKHEKVNVVFERLI